ncbi:MULTISPECIES: helix-turn-helix transcriptional regulator [Alcanivorax]|uniref:helix-turn-helix domain-containing protein n=1 Tax=Alcanivorax TaxID=59753 RepID=UPI0025BA0E8C|nr:MULTISPECIES: helix-turn-helix transcriptional regulator [Alcanivorax]
MDKRYTQLTPHEQLARRQAVYQSIAEQPGQPLAQIVALLRKELRLTLDEMSRLTGVSVRVIHSIENGQGNPTLGTAEKLLRPFGLRLGVVK